MRFRHALRRLKAAYPGEFCGWSAHSAPQVYAWALRLAAIGHPIAAAEAAAQRIGLDWQRFVAAEKAEMEACAAAKASAQAAGEEGVLV